MIPKIIHLCWLSGDKFPDSIMQCLATWKTHLKDYEIWLWGKCPTDSESLNIIGNCKVVEFDIKSTIWTKQAFEAKKYAFAADYIRLYALYNYGGIYLDSDVIVYKSFDELLSLPYFIGHDQIGAFEAAVIGTEKGFQWIKDILDRYDGRGFIKSDGTYDMQELPITFHHRLIEKGYEFKKIHEISPYHNEEKLIYVFDGDFFNSRNQLEVRQTKKSFCAHNYAGTWTKKTGKTKLKEFLPKSFVEQIIFIGQKTWNRNKYKWLTIPFE